MKPILSLEDFNVTYKAKADVYAVKNVSFAIQAGDSLGIVGESGSGKSTLAMALLGLLPKDCARVEGLVDFDGQELLSLSPEELGDLRWKELSVVFQKSMNSLSPVHRIRTQVEDIYRVHEPKASKQEVKERFIELLKLVNLGERVYNLYPHQLSGGMLQRISIAISLLHDPKLLILDEATTALDVVTQGQILDEIVKMETQFDMTRMMITHDISVVASSCNKVAVLYAGELMEFGTTKSVLKKPKHPYTQGLIDTIPELEGDVKTLQAIKGSLPDLSEIYEGCVFEPRCPHAMPVCRERKAKPVQISEDQTVYCHLYEGDE